MGLSGFSAFCSMHSILKLWYIFLPKLWKFWMCFGYFSGIYIGIYTSLRFTYSLIGPSEIWIFRKIILKLVLVVDDCGISCEIALIWLSLDRTDGNLTLVQPMAWRHRATSHYLGQFWFGIGHNWYIWQRSYAPPPKIPLPYPCHKHTVTKKVITKTKVRINSRVRCAK